MAPGLQKCMFSFARLGGLCIVALVSAGLMSNLKAFGRLPKKSINNYPMPDTLVLAKIDPTMDEMADSAAEPSKRRRIEEVREYQEKTEIVVSKSKDSVDALATPILHAKQANCKGDSFYNQKGVPYYRRLPERGNMNGSKAAIVFRGDSFRTKLKAGSEKRLANQLVASESHVKFLMRELVEASFQVDIFVDTWMNQDWQKTDGIAMLKSKFEPLGKVFFNIKEKRPATQGDGMLDAIGFLKAHTKARSADELPYDFVCILRFDVVLTSSIAPLFAASSIAYTRVLYPMRDANRGYYGWKNQAFVHDTMQWIPKRYFKAFMEEVVGNHGCFAKSTDWYGGSGHGCWVETEKKKKLAILQGFWHEGCFAVKDTHPLYYINEMRRTKR